MEKKFFTNSQISSTQNHYIWKSLVKFSSTLFQLLQAAWGFKNEAAFNFCYKQLRFLTIKQ